MPEAGVFSGEIVVASRIVDYLSSGLYESPSACLKELVNNSYDADAQEVKIFIKPDADRIIIEDDGCGMDRADFERHFRKISESHKREDSDYTPSGRPKIGKIGIGFIAANEICDVMQIVSTKEGSTELLEVTIRFDLMRQEPSLRMRSETEVAKADYVGRVTEFDPASHFTQVFLKNIRGEAKSILAGAGTSKFASGARSLYGLKQESVSKILRDGNLRTWSEFDAYSRNRLEVGLNVPVRYHVDWLPRNIRTQVSDLENQVAELNFTLFFDGSEVRKPIVFSPNGKAFIDRFEFNGEHVGAIGYFYAQDKTIRPQELQGLLVRIRHAAVGGYDPTFLGFSPSRGALFQNWISGEILVDDRLEDAMNIDRRTLRLAHPAYVELQKAVHSYLEELIRRVRGEIYGSRSKARQSERAKQVEERIITVASQEIERVAPVAAKQMRRAWEDATSDSVGQRRLLRKYSVDELYELVIDVAKETLKAEQLNHFLNRLTERLRQ